MGDLVWVIFFSQDFFSATYDGVRFFFQHHTPGEIIFFSAGYLFPRNFLATFYVPSKSVCRIFFPQITHNHPPHHHHHPAQTSNGGKPSGSPALLKQRLLLVLESILQILHYNTVA